MCTRGSPSQNRRETTRPISPHHVSPGTFGCAACTLGRHPPPSGIQLHRKHDPVRLKSTPQEETCKWPVPDCPGCVSKVRPLTPPLSSRHMVHVCPPASLLSVVQSQALHLG